MIGVDMMTNEQFMEFLRKIKEHCKGRACSMCDFHYNDKCQFRSIAIQMSVPPSTWDMKEIGEIVVL